MLPPVPHFQVMLLFQRIPLIPWIAYLPGHLGKLWCRCVLHKYIRSHLSCMSNWQNLIWSLRAEKWQAVQQSICSLVDGKRSSFKLNASAGCRWSWFSFSFLSDLVFKCQVSFRFWLILFSSAKLLIENDLRKKSNKRLISNIFWPLECQQMQTWCRMLTVLLQKAWKHVL